MMLGTAANTYTAPGIVSPASRATQSGPVEVVSERRARQSGNRRRIPHVSDQSGIRRIDENTQGVAIALAMGGIYVPEARSFSVAAGYGTFDGAHAFATQMAVRLDLNTILTGGIGFGLENNDAASKVGGRLGFQVSW